MVSIFAEIQFNANTFINISVTDYRRHMIIEDKSYRAAGNLITAILKIIDWLTPFEFAWKLPFTYEVYVIDAAYLIGGDIIS